jgi:hypothetical protein
MLAVWPQQSKSTRPSRTIKKQWMCLADREVWCILIWYVVLLTDYNNLALCLLIVFFFGAGFLWTRKWFADRAPPYCAHFDGWCPGQSHPLFGKLFRQRVQPEAPWKALTWKKKKNDCLRVVAWNITPASPAVQFIFSGSSYPKWPHPIPSSLTSRCWPH